MRLRPCVYSLTHRKVSITTFLSEREVRKGTRRSVRWLSQKKGYTGKCILSHHCSSHWIVPSLSTDGRQMSNNYLKYFSLIPFSQLCSVHLKSCMLPPNVSTCLKRPCPNSRPNCHHHRSLRLVEGFPSLSPLSSMPDLPHDSLQSPTKTFNCHHGGQGKICSLQHSVRPGWNLPSLW